MRLKSLLLLLFVPIMAHAQGAHRLSQIITRNQGVQAQVEPNAKITVCAPGTGCAVHAQIYSDINLTQPAPNPVTADVNGNFGYYVSAGCYDERYTYPGANPQMVFNVCLGSASGSQTVIEVNSTPTSPVSPVNFVDSASVTWTLSGATVFATANSGLTLQHNGVNLTDQVLLNFDDTTPTPPTGYSNVTFQSDSSGKLSAYALSTGQFETQVIPPISGQYVVVYPTVGTITNDPRGDSTISAQGGVLNWSCVNSIGLCTLAPTMTANWSGFTLPSYVNPANVTAVYADAVSAGSPFFGQMPTGGADGTQLTCTGIPGSTATLFPTYGAQPPWNAEKNLATTLTGAGVATASCSITLGASSFFGGSGISVNVSAIRLLVYYTGTPPPTDTSIKIVPPLCYDASALTLGDCAYNRYIDGGSDQNVLTLASSNTGALSLVMNNTSVSGGGFQLFEGGSANGNPGSFGVYNNATGHQPLTIKANDAVILSSLTAGTSPICPNGTGGALTTVGCTGGGGGTPGGSNTQIQFNNSGAFGGSNLTWNGSTLGMTTGKQFFGNATHDAGTFYDYEYQNDGTPVGGSFENMAEFTYAPNYNVDEPTASITSVIVNNNPITNHALGKLVGLGAGTNILGNSNFNEARGIDVSASNFGTGNGNGIYGADIAVENFTPGSTITNGYGVMIQANAGAGTITNLYGIYIKPQVAGTNNYNFYSAGAGQHNTIEGDLKVGFGSTPSNVCTVGNGLCTGSGTVTSVGLTVPAWLTVSGSPVTTAGTLGVTATTGQTANQFLATPNGSSGAVGLRAIAAADLPLATTGAFGAVKPDGTTVTISGGVISASGGGGGLSGQTTGYMPLATSATTSTTSSGLQDTGSSLVYHTASTQHALVLPASAGGLVTPVAGDAGIGTDASGNWSAYENGGSWSRICTVGNGLCSGTASPLTTKGDLYGFSTVNARIPVGTNNQTLVADSTQALGLKWADRPVQLSTTFVGVPANSQVMFYAPATVALTVPSSCTGSYAKAAVAATGTAAFTITDVTTSTTLCTATWSASGTIATFSGTGGSVSAGDVVQIAGPATADATLATIGVSVYATR